MTALVLFRAGGKRLGLNMHLVRSIQRASALMGQYGPLEHEGTLMLGGEQIPVHDLSVLLGGGTGLKAPEHKKVILASTPEFSIALMVDDVNGVIEVEDEKIAALPSVCEESALSCFPRVLKYDDSLILLLAPEGLERTHWTERMGARE